MKPLNKKKRREIYLKLAEIFEEASTKNSLNDKETFLYLNVNSFFVCTCLRYALRENDEPIIWDDDILLSNFPEFMLFKPTDEEKLLLEDNNFHGGHSAWWDIKASDVYEKKTIALYLCVEMCE